ncbi:MAG: LEPR-XLL domain-containing protein, partial [Planctomycetota bacterium]
MRSHDPRLFPPAVLEALEPRLMLSGDPVTSVSILEMDGVTTADYPVTLSLIFAESDVAENVTARVGAVELATQTDVKNRYGDDSVKHALVSFVLPELGTGQEVVVEILDGGTNADGDYVDVAELLATDFEAQMSIEIDGAPHSVSARGLLAGIGAPEYWLQGEVASELLIRDFDVNIDNQLNVQYYVRTYAGWSGMRIEAVVENCWTTYRGNLTYDFDLAIGNASPQTVMSRSDFTHNYNARWHETFWLGTQPGEIQIEYDLDYMISTGILPNYDTSLVISDTTIQSAYNSYQNSAHDLMERGIVTAYFPTTGGRQEIGIYPTWAARYLLSMDNRMREVTLGCADTGGYIPVHLRESDPTRANYQKIISIDDRPTVWAGWWDYDYTDPADALPAPIGSTSTIWSVDKAHQASFATIPYLITGDYYYFEEMNFWAAWDLADDWYPQRQKDKGIVEGQTRGEAWAIRNIADAANLAPDMHADDAAYFNEKINNTLIQWAADRIGSPGTYGAYNYWGLNNRNIHAEFISEATWFTSPWQEDFVMIVLTHLRDIGYDTDALRAWLGVSLVNRFYNDDYNPYRGAPYHIAVRYDPDGDGIDEPIPTWELVNSMFIEQPGPSSFPNPNGAADYNAIAWAALGQAVDVPYGQVAWQWLDGRIGFGGNMAVDPTWALLPPSDDGDLTPPAEVVDLAVTDTGDSYVELTWTAVGDDGTTGTAMVYDIRYSTSGPIDDANWDSAVQVADEPFPLIAGSTEVFTARGLRPDTPHWFAMKVGDNRYQYSGLSNVADTTTLPDATPPDDVTDLAVTGVTMTTVTLSWTATGDDGMSGAAD